ncbi:MAG: hypothetical protein Q8P76_02490 [bacterium]|nr:hypothetical protein [bacterium]
MFRIFLSTAIISLGLAGGFYFVTSYHLPTAPQSQPTALTLNNNPVSNQPLVEQLMPPSLENYLAGGLLAESSWTEGGLASEISGDLAQFLIENNPEEPDVSGGKQFIQVPTEQDVLNSILAKSSDKLNDLRPIISDADLNISASVANEDLKNYSSRVKNLLAGYRSGLTTAFNQQQADIAKLYQADSGQFLNNLASPESSINNPEVQKQYLGLMFLNYKYFSNLILLLSGLEGKLYAVSVPRPAIELHKNLLSLVIARKNILTEIQTPKTRDPLTTLLNQQMLQTIDSEFAHWMEVLPNLSAES